METPPPPDSLNLLKAKVSHIFERSGHTEFSSAYITAGQQSLHLHIRQCAHTHTHSLTLILHSPQRPEHRPAPSLLVYCREPQGHKAGGETQADTHIHSLSLTPKLLWSRSFKVFQILCKTSTQIRQHV